MGYSRFRITRATLNGHRNELMIERREFKVSIEEGQCPQCGDDGEELGYHDGTGMYYCESCWEDHEDKWTDKE